MADQLPWAFDAGYKDGQVDQAKAILEEAGWKDTDGDGIREKDGQKAEFTVYYKASAVERQAIAVTLAEQAKELGIEITPKGASWDEIDPDKYSVGMKLTQINTVKELYGDSVQRIHTQLSTNTVQM